MRELRSSVGGGMMGASCWQGDQEGRKGGGKVRRGGRTDFLTFLGGQLASCHQAEQGEQADAGEGGHPGHQG